MNITIIGRKRRELPLGSSLTKKSLRKPGGLLASPSLEMKGKPGGAARFFLSRASRFFPGMAMEVRYVSQE